MRRVAAPALFTLLLPAPSQRCSRNLFGGRFNLNICNYRRDRPSIGLMDAVEAPVGPLPPVKRCSPYYGMARNCQKNRIVRVHICGDCRVVGYFKFLGLLKSGDGNCIKDNSSRIGMTKKRMLDLAYRSGETEE